MQTLKGISGGQYKPLTESDIQAIHETSFRVLSEIGIQVNLPEAREMFRKAGAHVDDSKSMVKVPQNLVWELIARAPSTVNLYGRGKGAEFDCEIGGTRVWMGTGGTALNVQDPGSSESRPARLADVANMAWMVEKLDNIHFFMLNVYPNDLPAERVDVNRFAAALNYTRKHIMGGVYTVEGVRNVIRMAEMIAGSREALQERPFISMVTCIISPFKLDEHYSKLAVRVARAGIPLILPSEPLCGATAPITLAGNLVVFTVDTLAGVMLAQMVRPGTPVLAGCVSSITDMRDLKYLSGAIEMGLLNAGAAQMAHFYRLPIYTTAGMSDSKINDAQAGYESALTNLMVALAGGNLIHDAAGFLEFCLTASYDKLIIDNEIIGMVMRALAGITVNKETLAFDVLKKAGPGGHFVAHRHTRRHMRRELYRPTLSDRQPRDRWGKGGATDASARATKKALRILNAPHEQFISEGIRKKILEKIKGLDPQVFLPATPRRKS